mgnify:FL=1
MNGLQIKVGVKLSSYCSRSVPAVIPHKWYSHLAELKERSIALYTLPIWNMHSSDLEINLEVENLFAIYLRINGLIKCLRIFTEKQRVLFV